MILLSRPKMKDTYRYFQKQKHFMFADANMIQKLFNFEDIIFSFTRYQITMFDIIFSY